MREGREASSAVRRQLRRARHHTSRVAQHIRHHAFSSRKRMIVTLLIIAFVPIVLVQLFYSTTSLLPNTYVGSVKLSGMDKLEAADKLDEAYAEATVPIYFTDSDEVVTQPTLGDLGFTVENKYRVDEYSYPFLARLVPYSLFWYQWLMDKGEPQVDKDKAAFDAYIVNRFGEDCEFAPENATIAYKDDELQVIDASRGGSCIPGDLISALKEVTVELEPAKVVVEGTSTPPEVSTEMAQEEYDRLVKQLGDGITLIVKNEEEEIPTDTVAQWVEYSVVDGELQLGLASDKVAVWLNETYGELYNYDAGTTVVNLLDYKEDSRESGKNGSLVNTTKTEEEVIKDLRGEQDTARLMIDTLQPNIEYTRSYSASDAALSKVMKDYADSHAGVYGVKMVELSGSRRNAEYRSTESFTTASTYKMFVAYSVLLRIESGELTWTQSSYGNYSLSTCFDRMIIYSDNECAIWLFLKVGYDNVMNDARAIGATNTTFIRGKDLKSTPADEAHLLSLLYTGQILSEQASRDRMITAMKGNVYVAGIPTGIPDATIADKVGFLDGLLHDAAIVYSKKGDYVLIIMTNGSSWANIAELAGEIEAAR